ncbi:MAG: hypothetical protein JSU77_07585 [Fidelibacterota bacterium]|nr:MAG: hypothetical protein JSU77_07585 [Candidatus Neomarinimicrobiota bacterium]
MKRSNKITFAIFVVVLIGTACDLPTEPGPQPTTIIKTKFERGLNILGILRLDDSTGTSFIHVEQACRTEEIYDVEFPIIIEDAEVVVRKATDTTTYLFEADTVWAWTYTNPDFFPTAGEQYALTITHSELDTLTATTEVPVKPAIDTTTLTISESILSFDLLTTTDTYLYDVYLISPSDSLHSRFSNQGEGVLPVAFNPSVGPGQVMTIHIYGYDANLAEYLTAVTTIKYQTYLETVTTVTGGYGAFGSVSVFKMELSQ